MTRFISLLVCTISIWLCVQLATPVTYASTPPESPPIPPYNGPIGQVGGYIWKVFTYDTDTRRYLYAKSNNRLEVFDVTTASQPTLLATLPFTATIQDVQVVDGIAYIAARGFRLGKKQGLYIWDLTNPVVPQEIGVYASSTWYGTMSQIETVMVHERYAYLGIDENKFQIVDIFNPAKPQEVGRYDLNNRDYEIKQPDEEKLDAILDLTIAGDFAYVAGGRSWRNGLRVFDISEPMTPTLIGTYQTPHPVGQVFIHETYAYLLTQKNHADENRDEGPTIHIVDISQPDSPTQVGKYEIAGFVRDGHLVEGLLYVVDDRGGLRILDLTEPRTPIEIGQFDPPESILSLATTDDTAYLAGEYGLRTVDITDHACRTGTSIASGYG